MDGTGLDGLAAKERHGEKVILPVWHNVTYDDVEQYSPELADRLAVSTERGLTGVVRQILRACRKHKARQEPPKPPGKQEVPHVHQEPQSPPSTQVETQEPEKKTKPKPPPQKPPEPPAIHLRSEPLTVSVDEALDVFKLHVDEDGWWRPLEYIQNEYEDQGEVVVDHATGLMWQKSGSENWLTYKEAQKYIEKLNRQKFAGYTDWRLPTIPELMSLLEPKEQSNNLYINPIFDVTQKWCWSADRRSSGAAWGVSFAHGTVDWDGLLDFSHLYVRCVCS